MPISPWPTSRRVEGLSFGPCVEIRAVSVRPGWVVLQTRCARSGRGCVRRFWSRGTGRLRDRRRSGLGCWGGRSRGHSGRDLGGLRRCGGRGGSGHWRRPGVRQVAKYLGPLVHVPAAESGSVRDHAAAVDSHLGRLLEDAQVGNGLPHRVCGVVGVPLACLQVLQLVWSLRRVDADSVELDPVREFGVGAAQTP